MYLKTINNNISDSIRVLQVAGYKLQDDLIWNLKYATWNLELATCNIIDRLYFILYLSKLNSEDGP